MSQTIREIRRLAGGLPIGIRCSRKRCNQPALYSAVIEYYVGVVRRNRVKSYCQQHALRYAERHSLDLIEEVQRDA